MKDGDTVAIRKRGSKGLLAGLYEFPNLEGHLSEDEVIAYCKEIGLSPLRIKKLAPAKHIFSHIEWEMIGYHIRVDELEKSCTEKMIFVQWDELKEEYAMPSAFEAYVEM